MSLSVELLEQSFEKIRPRADEFAASFYENLFATHPEVEPLFATTDMEKQQKKLLNALVLVVENLRNPEVLGQVLRDLGARHIGYGALAQHYGPVGKALLLTIEQYVGEDWTPELKQTWLTAYRAITTEMLKGAGIEYAPEKVPLETKATPQKQVAHAKATPAKHKIEEVPSQPKELPVETRQTSFEKVKPHAEEVQSQTRVIPEKQVITAEAADSQPKELPVGILQKSFEKIEPRTEEFVASFYENLFAAHPELKPLFANTDTAIQQKHLLKNLGNPQTLGEALNALGVTRVGDNGAILKHYPAVGKALLKTFKQYLQQDWTSELQQGWVKVFKTTTAQMLKGASLDSPPKQVLLEIGVIPKKQVADAEAALTEEKIEAVASEPKELPKVQLQIEATPKEQVATGAQTQQEIEELPEEQPKELPVELLQRSFEKIKPRGDEFAASFYENLFAAHPEVKPLFSTTDMEKQQKKLLNALVLVVEGLRNPEVLGQVLRDLGARHIGYGALAQHYGPVGKALLLTIEQYVGEDWTPELKQAWLTAYRAITTEMLKGAGVEYAPEKVPLETKATPQKKQVATPSAAPSQQKIQEVPQPKDLPVEILQKSFEKVKPRAQEFAASFYKNLFAAHPEVEPLFLSTDMEKQQKKLFNALVLVVEGLRNPDALEQVLQDLGARHIGYGALSQHYGPIGEALLMSFEQYLQQDWTPEVKLAWVNAYRAIAAQMLKGAGEDVPEDVQLNIGTIPEKQLATAPTIQTQQKIEEVPDSEPKELPVELLQQSFEKIKPRGTEFAASFYENLFAANPEVKPLFATTDMEKQEKKLLNALVLVVEGLRNPEVLQKVLQDLGARHIGYGALSLHYGPVGKALLLTIEQYVGEDWTPEVKQAWVTAYKAITTEMLKGAGVETSPKVVREEKATTLEKPSQLKAEPLNETKQIQLPYEQPKKPLISIEWPGKLLEQVQGKIAGIYQQFQPQLLVEGGKELLKQILGKASDTFWKLPTWAVALVAAVIMAGVFLITDENSALAKILSGSDAISLLVAVVLFIKEAPDRKKQFHYQAWSTIDAAHGVKVSFARILAMQDLNQDGVSLRGLDTPGAELTGIVLPKVNLSEANLSKSDLSNANLSNANFNNTNLTQAKISGANISNANLSFARLSQANLSSANLSGANLVCADLSKANMSGVNLKNATLSGANFNGALLIGANLKDAKVSISELKGASLEGATMPDGTKYKSQKGSK